MFGRLREGIGLLYTLSQILSRRTAYISIAVMVLSLCQFGVELSLAVSLQALFYSLGLVHEKPEYLSSVMSFDNTAAVLGLFLVIGTLRSLFTWLQSWITGLVVVDCEAEIRGLIVLHGLNRRDAQMGRVADLFNDKSIGTSNFLSSTLNIVSRFTLVGLIMVSMFSISTEITSISLLSLIVLVIPISILNARIRRYSGNLHRDIASTMSRLLAGIRNSLLLHIYGTKGREVTLAQRSLANYKTAYGKYFALSGFKAVLPTMFGVWMIGIISLSVKEIDPLKPAVLVSYLYLFLRFVTSLGEIANLGSYLSLTAPRAKVICDWWLENFRAKNHKYLENMGGGIRYNNWEPSKSREIFHDLTGWSLEKVSFTYEGTDMPVLENISLSVAPGKCLAIVGESGSGKSSLLALLLGLNTPTEGTIYILAKNGARYPLSEVKEAMLDVVGYVGPESFLVAGTIRDNLLYGIGQYSDAELFDALKLAECDFVFKFGDGLDHVITEQGEGISAGQKQRLALARALVRQPKLLVLDEATANLDDQTESRLKDTLATFKEMMTICLVTHRKSLLEIADETVCLQRN